MPPSPAHRATIAAITRVRSMPDLREHPPALEEFRESSSGMSSSLNVLLRARANGLTRRSEIPGDRRDSHAAHVGARRLHTTRRSCYQRINTAHDQLDELEPRTRAALPRRTSPPVRCPHAGAGLDEAAKEASTAINQRLSTSPRLSRRTCSTTRTTSPWSSTTRRARRTHRGRVAEGGAGGR